MAQRDNQRASLLGGGPNGFTQIPEPQPTKGRRLSSPSPNDATIDIPLTTVQSKTSKRAPSWEANEKQPRFKIGLGGRRRRRTENSRHSEGGEGLTSMGKLYKRILNFSIITRYFLYLFPVGSLIAVPIVVGATAAPNARIGGVRIVWFFTWILVVWCSLWVSKLVAKLLPTIFEFLCGIVSAGTRKYALVMRALEIPLSLAGWALASLCTFIPIMTLRDTPRDEWKNVMNNVLAALLVCSLILLAEKILIQLISISYHRMQYDLKIKESKQKVHILGILYDASVALFPAYCPEFSEEDYLINDSPDLQIPGTKSAASGTATPMRLIQNVGRVGDKITAAFGHIAHEVTGKKVFNPTSSHSIIVEALEKKRSSEALAKRIWMSLVVEGKEALYQEDVVEVLATHSQSEAVEAFQALDKDGNGDVSLDEMILTVCTIGQERKSIASSLHDVDQAISVLDSLLCTIVFIMCIFVFVGFLNASFTTTLATAGTALLSLSFVFASTAQEVLGSCIFLFVKHPFDVGDRVDIGAEQLIVERISLLYTVFKNLKTHKTTQAPNVVLNNVWIDNVTRSKAMRESLLLYINFDTTLEDIQLLRKEMQSFVLDKENSRDFEPEIDVEVTGIAEMNKLELRVEIRHKSNWSNETVRAARRSKFMCALVLALRKVPIYAPGGGGAALGSADQPSYTVAISDSEASSARAAFDKKKEQKHMNFKHTTKPSVDLGFSTGNASFITDDATLRNRSPPIGSQTETSALNALNARDPTSDSAHNWQTNDAPSSPRRKRGTDDDTRSQDPRLDEVYGLLHRSTTRGKRRESYGLAPQSSSNIPTIAEHSPDQAGTDENRPPRQDSYNPYISPARYEYASGSSLGLSQSPTGGFPNPPAPPGQGQIRVTQPAQPASTYRPAAGPGAPVPPPSERPAVGRNNSFATEDHGGRRA